jgi:hypothetical protein
MKANWCVIFGIFFGLVLWSLVDIQSVHAGWSGSYQCGHVSCTGTICSSNGVTGCIEGNSCDSNRGTCTCNSTGSCGGTGASGYCSADCNSYCTDFRGCKLSCSCCGSGACVNGSGACYTSGSDCVKDGWNGCASCWNYCDRCPDDASYCAGSTYTGNCGTTCNGTKSCAVPTPTPTSAPTCYPCSRCSANADKQGYMASWMDVNASCTALNRCSASTYVCDGTCGSATTYGSWGTCSAACNGTQTRRIYNQCGSFMGNDSRDCNVNCITPTPTPTPTPRPTPTPVPGTIRARAIVVDAAKTSCTDIRASATGIPKIHQFTRSSESQPAPQTQSGTNYVTFAGLIPGSYTIDTTAPPSYIFARACWTDSVSGSPGETISHTLTAADTVTWDLGYTSGMAWSQAQGGDVYASATLQSYVPAGAVPRAFILNGAGGYPGVATYGQNYKFDSSGATHGETWISSKNWLVADTDFYQLLYGQFGGTPATVDYVNPASPVSQPASRVTPYYVPDLYITTPLSSPPSS